MKFQYLLLKLNGRTDNITKDSDWMDVLSVENLLNHLRALKLIFFNGTKKVFKIFIPK